MPLELSSFHKETTLDKKKPNSIDINNDESLVNQKIVHDTSVLTTFIKLHTM